LITTKINAKPHAGQLEVHNSDARFKVLSAGRRWGKTRLGVNECLDVAAQGGRAWWVSPSYKTSEVGWRPLRQIARKIPNAEVRLVDRMVTLPGGGFVAVRSADNPDSLRGEGLDFVVMDECAFMQREAWTEAIRPALSDRQGKALFISTPKGRNWFWENYQRGINGEEGWQSWTFPTVNNPYIEASEVEAARRDLPEIIFRQEYLAEFIDDQGGVFRRVQEAAVLSPQEPQPGRQYVAGVDVASSVDFTVVSVLDAETKEMVYMDRFNRVDYPVLINRLESVYHRYRLTSMVVESNSIGRPVIDELVTRGLNIVPFTTTSATKQAIIQSLQSAFENGQILVLDEPVLVGELLSFESKRNASGSFSYSAPNGMHDDCVMSLAIAWSGMQERVQVIKNPFYEY
jgi:phage terminase large subunit-like protein